MNSFLCRLDGQLKIRNGQQGQIGAATAPSFLACLVRSHELLPEDSHSTVRLCFTTWFRAFFKIEIIHVHSELPKYLNLTI